MRLSSCVPIRFKASGWQNGVGLRFSPTDRTKGKETRFGDIGMSEAGKKCKNCKKPFHTRYGKQVFCSQTCRDRHYWKGRNERNDMIGMSTHDIGAVQELLVSVDLLKRGFDVFRAISTGCSCDLIIMKKQTFVTRRVEVTTGHTQPNGKICWPAHDPTNYDLLAVVVNGTIFYTPDL